MSNFNSKTDVELLRIVQNESDESGKASEVLIKRYTKLVELIASKYQNLPLEHDDICQEGMIGLFSATYTYDENKGCTFNTFASVCINNSIKSAIRLFYRQKDIPPTSIVELDDTFLDIKAHLSAEDVFLADCSVERIKQAIQQKLSKFEKSVLKLHIEGCSYAKIAENLGKNEKAIDNAMQRIRNKLKEVLF